MPVKISGITTKRLEMVFFPCSGKKKKKREEEPISIRQERKKDTEKARKMRSSK